MSVQFGINYSKFFVTKLLHIQLGRMMSQFNGLMRGLSEHSMQCIWHTTCRSESHENLQDLIWEIDVLQASDLEQLIVFFLWLNLLLHKILKLNDAPQRVFLLQFSKLSTKLCCHAYVLEIENTETSCSSSKLLLTISISVQILFLHLSVHLLT
jgi:hypothetical protein